MIEKLLIIRVKFGRFHIIVLLLLAGIYHGS